MITDEISDIDQRRLIVPGLGGLYRSVAPLAYAFTRVLMGLLLVANGIDKVFQGGAGRIAAGSITKTLAWPYPYAWAWAVAGLEFFGAILLAFGLFTRPVAFALTVMLAVIAFGIMSARGWFWTTGGMEVAVLMMLVTLAFTVGGGGRYSLDRLIGREF